jgi:pimeloyl-ACP methyl ester carboxylesterase
MKPPGKRFQQKFVQLSDLRFNYLEWGTESNPPIVLLHGLQSHARSWDQFACALQERHRILALDQRGHGDTDWPDPPSYATSDFTSDLFALIKRLGINRIALIGLSMGAHNALAFTIRYPELVEKLVSVDIPASLQMLDDPKVRSSLVDVKREFACLDEMVEDARDIYPFASEEMIRHLMEHNSRQLPTGRLTLKYSPDAPRLWNPDDLSESIKTIQCPTLIVRGGESEVLTAAQAQTMTDKIPNARLITITGAGHSVPMDKPVEFEVAVRDFLAE